MVWFSLVRLFEVESRVAQVGFGLAVQPRLI